MPTALRATRCGFESPACSGKWKRSSSREHPPHKPSIHSAIRAMTPPSEHPLQTRASQPSIVLFILYQGECRECLLTLLHNHQQPTDDHHKRCRESFPQPGFFEQQRSPHHRKDGAQLEQCSHIAYIAKGNRAEAKQWCDPTNQAGSPKQRAMPAQLIAQVSRAAPQRRGQKHDREEGRDEGNHQRIFWRGMLNGNLLKDRGKSPYE